MTVAQQLRRHCPECGSTNLVRDPSRGELTCSDCGVVVTAGEIDTNGRRFYNQEERDARVRTGPPRTVFSLNPMTKVGKDGRLRGRQRQQMYRLRQTQRQNALFQSSLGRGTVIMFATIEKVCTNLGLPDTIKERACHLVRKHRASLQGLSLDSIALAYIFYACRERQVPISLRGLAKAGEKDRLQIYKTYCKLFWKIQPNLPVPDPCTHVPKAISELDLPQQVENDAIRLLKSIRGTRQFSGKSPQGLAAGATYIVTQAHGLSVSQKDIANVVGCTEVTLRNRYKDIARNVDIDEILS